MDQGYKNIVLCSIDTNDRRNDITQDKIYQNIFNKLDKCNFILIHPTANTAESMSKVLEDLLSQNYKILPIGEMLKK